MESVSKHNLSYPIIEMSLPHFSGPTGHVENRAPYMIGMEIAMLVVAMAATVMRTCLRKRSVGRLRMEDWCCIGATVRTPPRRLVSIGRQIMFLDTLKKKIVSDDFAHRLENSSF